MNPARIVQIRHDVAVWWDCLTEHKRKIAEALALEYTTGEVAAMFGCTSGRVSQVRRELAMSWEQVQYLLTAVTFFWEHAGIDFARDEWWTIEYRVRSLRVAKEEAAKIAKPTKSSGKKKR
jgi:hypothetical protein